MLNDWLLMLVLPPLRAKSAVQVAPLLFVRAQKDNTQPAPVTGWVGTSGADVRQVPPPPQSLLLVHMEVLELEHTEGSLPALSQRKEIDCGPLVPLISSEELPLCASAFETKTLAAELGFHGLSQLSMPPRVESNEELKMVTRQPTISVLLLPELIVVGEASDGHEPLHDHGPPLAYEEIEKLVPALHVPDAQSELKRQ